MLLRLNTLIKSCLVNITCTVKELQRMVFVIVSGDSRQSFGRLGYIYWVPNAAACHIVLPCCGPVTRHRGDP